MPQAYQFDVRGFTPSLGFQFCARRRLHLLLKKHPEVLTIYGQISCLGRRFQIIITAETYFAKLNGQTELVVNSDIASKPLWELSIIDRVLWDLSQQLVHWDDSAKSDQL